MKKVFAIVAAAVMAMSIGTSVYAAEQKPVIETQDCSPCSAKMVVKVGDETFPVRGIMDGGKFYWVATDFVFKSLPTVTSSAQEPDETAVSLDQPAKIEIWNPDSSKGVTAYINDYRNLNIGQDDPKTGFEIDGEMVKISPESLSMMQRGYLPFREFYELAGFKVTYSKGVITIS
jgi:hypothetical protein